MYNVLVAKLYGITHKSNIEIVMKEYWSRYQNLLFHSFHLWIRNYYSQIRYYVIKTIESIWKFILFV